MNRKMMIDNELLISYLICIENLIVFKMKYFLLFLSFFSNKMIIMNVLVNSVL
jgi:hypothetical protein